MTNDYMAEMSLVWLPLSRDCLEDMSDIKFFEGMCAADKTDPENSAGMRTIAEYKEKVLSPGIANGIIGDGIKLKWDDRKLRFDFADFKYDSLNIYLDVSHYKAIRDDIQRNREENLRLQDIGKRRFNNRYAFFERGPGVTVIPITKDGSIYLAERKGVETGIGLLNGAAGNMEYTDNISYVNPDMQGRKEFLEEMGVHSDDITKMEFVGLYSDKITGEVDFTYLAKIRLDDKELMDAWDNAKDKIESGKRIRIPDYKSLIDILNFGNIAGSEKKWELMYATRGGLGSVKFNEMNN